MIFETYFSKELEQLEEEKYKKSIIIMIDVLRASTTICSMLFNGAKEVLPCPNPDDAWQRYRERDGINCVLAGEARLKLPKGFGLGNSPTENTSDKVKDKTIILSTSNGTKIFTKAVPANYRIIGSFVNADAVIDFILRNKQGTNNIIILCAGEYGEPCEEDLLCAGYFIDHLMQDKQDVLKAHSKEAELLYLDNKDDIPTALNKCKHSQDLYDLGLRKDVEFAGKLNICSVIPLISRQNIITSAK